MAGARRRFWFGYYATLAIVAFAVIAAAMIGQELAGDWGVVVAVTIVAIPVIAASVAVYRRYAH